MDGSGFKELFSASYVTSVEIEVEVEDKDKEWDSDLEALLSHNVA